MAIFYRCHKKCQCGKSKCETSGLKMCKHCSNILRSRCGKKGCIVDGKKPEMLLPNCDKKFLKVKEVYTSPFDFDSDSFGTDDNVYLDISIDIQTSSTEDVDSTDESKEVENLETRSMKRGAQFRRMIRNLDLEFNSDNDS